MVSHLVRSEFEGHGPTFPHKETQRLSLNCHSNEREPARSLAQHHL